MRGGLSQGSLLSCRHLIGIGVISHTSRCEMQYDFQHVSLAADDCEVLCQPWIVFTETNKESVTNFSAYLERTMENYRKGKNVEEEITRDRIPIPDLPNNFIWMQVHGGSKIRNLLDVALKGFVEHGAVVWTGSGSAISKTISCAEILKRRHKAYQISKICYRKSEEFWEPLLPELDELVVVRDEPMIHILLSKDPLNPKELGYQAPGDIDQCFRTQQDKQNRSSKISTKRNQSKPYGSNSTHPDQRNQGQRSQKPNKAKVQS